MSMKQIQCYSQINQALYQYEKVVKEKDFIP